LVDSTTQGIPTGTFLEIGDLECRFFWKKMPCPSEARMGILDFESFQK
jgi:hypothetical protein